MRSVIVLFIFVLFCMPLMGQTNVSGTISVDSVWAIEGSPYYVIGDVTISGSATLTINSGVDIYFSTGTRFVVNGNIIADNVLFTSANEVIGTAEPGDWRYLGVFGTGSLNLNSCTVRYGGSYSSDPSNVYINSGTANLTGCDLSFASQGVKVERDGFLSLTTTNIFSCNWPITCYDGGEFEYNEGNSLTGNIYDGVYQDAYYGFAGKHVMLEKIDVPYAFGHTRFRIAASDTLEIESGNILKFMSGVELLVEGTLIAEAEAEENIYFTTWEDDNLGGDTNADATATDPNPRDWPGIYFANSSNDEAGIMTRCVVAFAGTTSGGAIDITNASPTINECELHDNYYGIWMDGISNPVISNTEIATSNIVPVAMSLNCDPVFTNNVFSARDNGYDAIGILGETLLQDATLKIRNFTNVENVTYLMLGEILIPEGITLTINDSIVVKGGSANYYFRIQGKLVADADADSVITFTSYRDDNHGNPNDTNNDGNATSPAVGDWSGFMFEPTADPTSIINNCVIKYAMENSYYYDGQYLSGGAITTLNTSPTFSNTLFENVRYAIFAYQSSNPVISNNTVNNSQYTPFALSVSANPVFSGNTFNNPGWEAIGLIGQNIGYNGTIRKRNIAGLENITYVLLGNITINSGIYVDVEPGVVIKANNTGIYVNGGFKAVGTEEEKIVFTSLLDDNFGNPGDTNGDGAGSEPSWNDWRTIYFQASSDDLYNEINYAIIKYNGSGSADGLSFVNAGGVVKNTLISASYNYGIRIQGDSEPQIDSVEIANCRYDPIAMSLISNPVFNEMEFNGNGNGSNGIRILEGNLNTDATLQQRDVAGIENIAYIIDALTINAGITLTIEPGVVIKFFNYYSGITVNGAIIADGTETENIVFTSLKDDAAGGDTNDDGNASVPAPGDWHSFHLNSSANENLNSFSNCHFLYGGNTYYVYNYRYGVIRFFDSYAHVDSCRIEQSSSSGVGIFGDSNPELSNIQMHVISSAPVAMSMFAEPVFENNILSNAGLYAIGIVPETYSQNATIPLRDFSIYENITYYLYSSIDIASGTEITIPAGAVFKNSFFNVYGALIVNGTELEPVIFTHLSDDEYGNPLDTQNDGSSSSPSISGTNYRIGFGDVSDDELCEVNYAIIRYADRGIGMGSSSPNINNCLIENCNWGLRLSGVSAPAVVNNTFNNLIYASLHISLVSYPSSTSGNVISGSTYRVIGVIGETLVQDISLGKRDFAGYTNIPYYFHSNYTIGTSVTLTIEPGVILKFSGDYYANSNMTVRRGLVAEGGVSSDSTIVFTSILDDFYGGDSNADSTATNPETSNYGWRGIIFEDEAMDELCRLEHCIFKYVKYSSYSYAAITANDASPNIQYCTFTENANGIIANNSSNPVINYCDIYDNIYVGVNNVHETFTIDAQNNWWGDNSGPTHSTNPGGIGDVVSDAVDFLPFLSDGTYNPDMGDVSLNGEIQPYDASLVLQHTVEAITLSDLQQSVADVSGEEGITSYDASLILQYTVGLIPGFPAEIGSKILNKTPDYLQLTKVLNEQQVDNVILEVGSVNTERGENVVIPIKLSNINGLVAWQAALKYDPDYLELESVTPVSGSDNMLIIDRINNEKGELRIAMAGTQPVESDEIVVNLIFKVQNEVKGEITSAILIKHFSVNEIDFSASAINGTIEIIGKPVAFGLLPNYPNPFNSTTKISYKVPEDNSHVKIIIYNSLGQKIKILVDNVESAGIKIISWDGKDASGNMVSSGIYIYRMEADKFNKSQRMLMLK